MTIFKRIRDIITASIHDMLDKVEDPEATLDEMIREMERGIADLRKKAATAIASEKMLERRMERTREETAKHAQHAETAVRHGKDDLARQALAKKRQAQETEILLTGQLTEQSAFVGQLREDLRKVEEKVQEARIKRNTLMMKRHVAASRERLMEQVEDADMTTGSADALAARVMGGYDAAARLQDEIDRRASESDARKEVRKLHQDTEAELRHLQEQDDVEQELNRLKRKLEE